MKSLALCVFFIVNILAAFCKTMWLLWCFLLIGLQQLVIIFFYMSGCAGSLVSFVADIHFVD